MKQVRVWRLGQYGSKIEEGDIQKFAKVLKAAYESENSDVIWNSAIDCFTVIIDPSNKDVILYSGEDGELDVMDVDFKQKKIGF